MWGGILGVGALFVAVMLALIFRMKQLNLDSDPNRLTVLFCVFVLLQFWNLFNAKCFGSSGSVFSRLGDSKTFLAIAATILGMQVVFVQFGGRIFRTVPAESEGVGADSCLDIPRFLGR